MLSLGKGFLTEKEAMKHAALWVKEDLEIDRNAFERQSDQNQTILREKYVNALSLGNNPKPILVWVNILVLNKQGAYRA